MTTKSRSAILEGGVLEDLEVTPEEEVLLARLFSTIDPEMKCRDFATLLATQCSGAILERQQELKTELASGITPVRRLELEKEFEKLSSDLETWADIRGRIPDTPADN